MNETHWLRFRQQEENGDFLERCSTDGASEASLIARVHGLTKREEFSAFLAFLKELQQTNFVEMRWRSTSG